MNKAIFFDRDGTLNFDSNHVFDHNKLFLLPGAADAIATAKKNSFKTVIITNQSCIGRGYAEFTQVNETNKKLRRLLLEENPAAEIDLILVAPDHPDHASVRRKPGSGMLYEAAENLNLDLKSSWVIGDKISDPACGVQAGIPEAQCFLLPPNQDQSLLSEQDSTTRFNTFISVSEAVNFIVSL